MVLQPKWSTCALCCLYDPLHLFVSKIRKPLTLCQNAEDGTLMCTVSLNLIIVVLVLLFAKK